MDAQGGVATTLLLGVLEPRLSGRVRDAWSRVSPTGHLAVARTSPELVALSAQLKPEFAILSEHWLRESGLDLLQRVASVWRPNVLVCGDTVCAMTVARGFAQGLRGILGSAADADLIGKALLTIRGGEMWVSRRKLLEALHSVAPAGDAAADTWRRLPSLSGREHAVLMEVLSGRANKDIAGTLGISESTVKAHVQHLYLKLGVHRRVDLLRAYLAPQAS